MNSKLKAVGIGLVCLVCCMPLIFAITGITAGAAAMQSHSSAMTSSTQ